MADTVRDKIQESLADPHHPWTRQWPTIPEMARELGTSPSNLRNALYDLREQGVVVKRVIPRATATNVGWVPTARAGDFPKFRSVEDMAALIARRASRSKWTVLPPLRAMTTLFDSDPVKIANASKLLARRGVVIKVRIEGQWRWRVLKPGEAETIDPRDTMAAPEPVATELLCRIHAGEFRYRTPDGVVHERPFLSRSEIKTDYGISDATATLARKILIDQGWLVPGTKHNHLYRLADSVSPIDRDTHPAPRRPRKPAPARTPNRYLEIADDLVARIRAREFKKLRRGLPAQHEICEHYHASLHTVRDALDELHRRGWVTFFYYGNNRQAQVPLPWPTNERQLAVLRHLRRGPRDFRPDYEVLADTLRVLVNDSLADPDHPWTMNWPTSSEMAKQLGTTQMTLLDAVHRLRDEGVLVKADMRRKTGTYSVWIPAARAPAHPARHSVNELATMIVQDASQESWNVVPPQQELSERYGTNRNRIIDAIQLLAKRGLAHKVRVGGQWRWCIVPPHRLHTIDPRTTVAPDKVVLHDVVRRIRAGEFRYRTPDGVVHERPFLANSELADQYGVSSTTVDKVRKKLLALGWIVPGPQSNAHARLAESIPPVDRDTHPPARRARKAPPRNARAQELADDLEIRIRAGEFDDRPFPAQVGLMREYEAGRHNVMAAFDELHRRGLIRFSYRGADRIAHLADSMPDATPD